jgi:carboxypeptidase C (cathepsin A)
MLRRLFWILPLLGLLAGALPAAAQPRNGVLDLLPSDSVTTHTLHRPGPPLAYTATAGTLPLFDQEGRRSAAIFYTAYIVPHDGSNRPVTFVFNGGPGAASAYLHLGMVGPRRLQFGIDGRDGTAPTLQDNPQTWLDFTDLVIIDPLGTGWSRTEKPDDAEHFWGVRQDAEVMAKTISLWLARNARSGSPKFLLGESYGGLRAAKVGSVLLSQQGVAITGIVMVSPLMDGALTFPAQNSALSASLKLPSLAAAEMERHHDFSSAALSIAEQFARTDYLTTLAGPPPSGQAADAFYGLVAQLTGIAQDVVARTHGFLGSADLKRAGQILSAYDASYAVSDPYPEQSGGHGTDPILGGYSRAFGGGFVDYARNELGFKTDMTYILLSNDVNRHWDWHSDSGTLSLPDVDDELRELLSLSPSFHLLVADGLTDLVTPYATNRYVLDHLPQIGAAGRVQQKLYHAGHMIYLTEAARLAFTNDVAGFYPDSN